MYTKSLPWSRVCLILCLTTNINAMPNTSHLDEIIVNAKAGATAINKTPMAISVFSESDLEQMNVRTIADLENRVPSLSVSQNIGFGRIYLRGVGSNNDFIGSDPSITIHMDGVYMARPQAIFNELIDIEQVEILRGPQGTLYGRNSIGGTIAVKSRLPDDILQARVSAQIGSFDEQQVVASVSGPLINNLFASLGILKSQNDGYFDNENNLGEADLANNDIEALRGTSRLLFNESSELILRADYSKKDDNGPVYKPTYRSVLGESILGPTIVSDPWTINTPYREPFYKRRIDGISATYLNAITDSIQFSSITAYRAFDTKLSLDTDFTDLDALITNIAEKQDQRSQEFQLNGNTDTFKWVTGVYFLREKSKSATSIELQADHTSPAAPATSTIDNTLTTTAYAVFGELNYQITDKLGATLGLRYSDEEKDFSGLGQLIPESSTVAITRFTRDKESDSWNSITPKFGLNYQINQRQLIYGSLSKGFKSGGYNFSTDDASFDQEILTALEFGFKSIWLENKLSTNLALFSYDYDDLQVQSFVVASESPTSAPQVLINNAAEASVNGIELELSLKPTESWLIASSLAYLDAEYDKYDASRSTITPVKQDLAGNKLNSTPELALNISANYNHFLINGATIGFRLEYYNQSEMFFTAFNDKTNSQDSFNLIHASVRYTSSNEKWLWEIFGKNLGDEAYATASQDFSPTGVNLLTMPPRTFSGRVSYTF